MVEPSGGAYGLVSSFKAVTISLGVLAGAVTQARMAIDSLIGALDDYRKSVERQRIRTLLGYDHEQDAPAWVKAVHEYKVSTFGSGNGRRVR